jgi:hypothetical protein
LVQKAEIILTQPPIFFAYVIAKVMRIGVCPYFGQPKQLRHVVNSVRSQVCVIGSVNSALRRATGFKGRLHTGFYEDFQIYAVIPKD